MSTRGLQPPALPGAPARDTSLDLPNNPMTPPILQSTFNRTGTVLLVEDDPNDAFFLQRACQASDIPHSLTVVNDGQAAVDYLSGTNGYADRKRHPLPDLVFLELKLPRRDGHEVLEWLRAQPALRSLPVVILTTSTDDPEIKRAYELGVTSCLMKDANLVQFFEATWIALKYWLELNVRPKQVQ